MAQPFDPDKKMLVGSATPIEEQVGVNTENGRAAFAASWKGVLTFRSGSVSRRLELVWYDRNGKEIEKAGEVANYRGISLSPDGTRAAVDIHLVLKSFAAVAFLPLPLVSKSKGRSLDVKE